MRACNTGGRTRTILFHSEQQQRVVTTAHARPKPYQANGALRGYHDTIMAVAVMLARACGACILVTLLGLGWVCIS